MEVDKEKDKQVSTETITKENEEKMELYKNMDTISVVYPELSITPIPTNIIWESFLFKLVYELKPIADTISSLKNY